MCLRDWQEIDKNINILTKLNNLWKLKDLQVVLCLFYLLIFSTFSIMNMHYLYNPEILLSFFLLVKYSQKGLLPFKLQC
jgi:hypothetical protein